MKQNNNQMPMPQQLWSQLQLWPQRWPRQNWPWPQAALNLWPEG